MRISLWQTDDAMPRTEYFARFREAVTRNRRFVGFDVPADMVLPAEDVALETYWPRYLRQTSAFVRGTYDALQHRDYLQRFIAAGVPCCLPNMLLSYRFPAKLADVSHVVVADITLSADERAANPRTISLPAMPLSVGDGLSHDATLLAAFRGTRSHVCRTELERLHDGRQIVCQIADQQDYAHSIDALANQCDEEYRSLMARSLFAFVPRGDHLFSYRLLEALSFGCIPVVLSDGWILPFDRTIDWSSAVLHVPEAMIPELPGILAGMPPQRVAQLQVGARKAYAIYLSSFDAMVESLLLELEYVLSGAPQQVPSK